MLDTVTINPTATKETQENFSKPNSAVEISSKE